MRNYATAFYELALSYSENIEKQKYSKHGVEKAL